MFLHLSVILFTGGLPQCMLGYHPPPPEQTPPRPRTPQSRHPLDQAPPPPSRHPPDQAPPGSRHLRTRHPPPPADGYCCGRYVSYWNAFLFTRGFTISINHLIHRNVHYSGKFDIVNLNIHRHTTLYVNH